MSHRSAPRNDMQKTAARRRLQRRGARRICHAFRIRLRHCPPPCPTAGNTDCPIAPLLAMTCRNLLRVRKDNRDCQRRRIYAPFILTVDCPGWLWVLPIDGNWLVTNLFPEGLPRYQWEYQTILRYNLRFPRYNHELPFRSRCHSPQIPPASR